MVRQLRFQLISRSRLPLVCVAAVVAFPLASAAAGTQNKHGQPVAPRGPLAGAVYSETNDPSNNQIVVFDRHPDGNLTQREVVDTGGQGGLEQQPGCTAQCPILDTQGEVTLSRDGRLLFAVNAGSNTISSFRVTPDGLTLVQTELSGGTFPNSLTTHGDLLYVLNSNSDSIAGFRVSQSGALTPIAGSVQPLSSDAMPGFPRQIGFDNAGKVLVVTLLAPDAIDTFLINPNGTPGAATGYSSTTPFPFGFSFDPLDQLVLSQITSLTTPGLGDTATYKLTSAGGVIPIDTEASDGEAPCWTAISDDGRYVYVVNSGGGAPTEAAVAEYRLFPDGKLKLLDLTPTIGEFAKTDEALSLGSRYLYVLAPSIFNGATSHIDEYRAGFDGRLTLIGTTPSTLPVGMSGLAAR